MNGYYRRQDVRRAILEFVRAGNGFPVREGAFYNARAGTLQRYLSRDDSQHRQPVVFGSSASLDEALREGATAFYSSYCRYSNPEKLSGPIGRDIVWTLRAESGGLSFAEEVTTIVLQVIEDEGFPEPWVKYSGALGFDLILPLETLTGAGLPTDAGGLNEFQRELTTRMADDVIARVGFTVNSNGSRVTIRSGSNTCLLSELGWSRGLLLAPMSLHPGSGLVSVPIPPEKVGSFSVMDASPESAHPVEWRVPSPMGCAPQIQELEWQAVASPIVVA